MSAWAYCCNDECHQPIQRNDYSMKDIIDDSYTCPTCGVINNVMYYSPAEALQDLFDRVTALEDQKSDENKRLRLALFEIASCKHGGGSAANFAKGVLDEF